jgi:hypothetical protein
MALQKLHNPELHEKALLFVDMVYRHHSTGSGEIPLLGLFEMFGIELEKQSLSAVSIRGFITLTATDSTCGTFSNLGSSAQFKQGIATIKTPPVISGIYVVDPDHCFFRFDPHHTILGAAYLVLSSKLKSIYIDRNSITIKMDDRDLDQVIKHRPLNLP